MNSCKLRHFADDTNLLHFSKSVNKFNKYINIDIKDLTDWLNANKISLNVKKANLQIQEQETRMSNKNETWHEMTKSVKSLGVKIDENLNWKDQTQDTVTKLN